MTTCRLLRLRLVQNSANLCLSSYRNHPSVWYAAPRTISTNGPKGKDGGQVPAESLFQDRSQNEGLLARLWKKLPLPNVQKSKIMAAGYFLYENTVDGLDYVKFIDELNLPDTFYSWFVITELHIWMLAVRVMAEGEDGQVVRNNMLKALWDDVDQRVKRLGSVDRTSARVQVQDLSEQLLAALLAYDEGLDSEDTVLASALWRRFYQAQDVNPVHLDVLVKYIRRNIRLLDLTPTDQFFVNKEISWGSLK